MGESKRDETGQFARGVDDDDVLAAVRAHDPAATSEIAEEVGISRQGADKRLRELRNAGEVSSKKIGASLVWFMPREHGRGSAWAGDDGNTGGTSTPSGDAESAATPAESDAADPVDAALAELDTTDDRRDAVRACVEYLREHGTGQRRDFLDAVYPDYPAGFGSEGGWWNKIGKEYLNAAADEYDAVTPPATEGSHTWRWEP